MNEKNISKEAIIDIDYERHFDKEFEGTSFAQDNDTSESLKNKHSQNTSFEKDIHNLVNNLGESINEVVNATKQAIKDHKIRSKLNFTILDDQEISNLNNLVKKHYKDLGHEIGLMMTSVGIFILASYSLFFIIPATFLLFLSIILIVNTSIKYSNNTEYLKHKNIQLSETNFTWIESLYAQYKNKESKAIIVLLIGLFLPLSLMLSFSIIHIYFFIAFAAFTLFIGLGIGISQIIKIFCTKDFYNRIINGKKFSE